MGKQINYFARVNDFENFYNLYITKDVVLVKDGLTIDQIELANDFFIKPKEYHNRVFLFRKNDLPLIKSRFVVQQNKWIIDTFRSPVIEFSLSFFDTQIIRRGRLYFKTGYYEGDIWVKREDSFVKWGDTLIRWVRRNFDKYDPPFWIGPKTKAWVQEENIKVLEN